MSIPLLYYHFDYVPLWQDHLSYASYFLLVLSLIICYCFKDNFLRSVFLFITLILAWYAHRIEAVSFLFIISLGILFYCSNKLTNKWFRGLFFILALAASIISLFIVLPALGFHNWKVADRIHLSPDALPYSLTLSVNKFLVGLFFVWFSAFSLANGGKWKLCLKVACGVGLLATAVLIWPAYYIGYVKFEPVVTNFFFLWAVANLLFTCLSEEALFRGMILKFLLLQLQHLPMGKWIALIMSAGLFSLSHYPAEREYMLLAGIAGLFYGYAFIKTEKIEASVLAHFIVNTVHFTAFTYPALMHS